MDLSAIRNINFVCESNLCTECGTCFGVCPKDNIEININNIGRYFFKTKKIERCKECSLCYDVCPGHEVDFERLRSSVFQNHINSNLFHKNLGHYEGLYLGYSTEERIRKNAASGGITSGLLSHFLENGIIDGVFMVRMRSAHEGDILSPEIYLATSNVETLRGQQSKYITVPLNLSLRDIIHDKDNKKFAFVGLGCQMHGLRKAELKIPKLRSKIAIRIGLFCGHSMNRLGTEHLLGLVNAKKDDLEHIEYRAGKWPGNFLAKMKSGEEKMIPHYDWTSYVLTVYEKWRCHFCMDPLCELADISLGDAHLSYLKGQEGHNLIISRTAVGAEFLDNAHKSGVIELSGVDESEILESQKRTLYRKKHLIRAYVKLAKAFRRSVPLYSGQGDHKKISIINYCQVIILHSARTLAGKRQARYLMFFLGKLYLRLKKIGMRKLLIRRT